MTEKAAASFRPPPDALEKENMMAKRDAGGEKRQEQEEGELPQEETIPGPTTESPTEADLEEAEEEQEEAAGGQSFADPRRKEGQ